MAPIALYVSMVRTLQLSSVEMIQNAVVAVLAIIVFWLLFTVVGARYGFARSALQEWLAILYLWFTGVLAGLYFGVRGEHVDLGQLYYFIAVTMVCVGWFYYAAIMPLMKRRRDMSGRSI